MDFSAFRTLISAITSGGCSVLGLTLATVPAQAAAVSLLLPQTRTGTVQSVRPVDIHGDRYLDLAVSLDDPGSAPVVGRVGAMECPPDLKPGDRVSLRFTMGVITSVSRA